MDLYNREVISWEISKRPTLDIAIEPLKEAISVIKKTAKYRTTIHSDQGWHYQHHSWVKTLKSTVSFKVCPVREIALIIHRWKISLDF